MCPIINVVYTGDKNYVVPIIVSMTSVVNNISKDVSVHFHLFIKQYDQEVELAFNKASNALGCEYSIYDMSEYEYYFDDVDVNKFGNQYINIVCYYRLLMLKILPKNVDKCFYIDGDIIVDTDLAEIYDKIGNMDIAAVVVEVIAMNDRHNILSHFSKWDECKKFNKDPYSYPYFNAGFFLLNVNLAREKKLWDRYLEFNSKHPNPKYADQDILNAIIGQDRPGNLVILPAEYNVFCDCDYDASNYPDGYYSVEEISKAFIKPKIYHYGGAYKPWAKKIRHHYSVWLKYAAVSPASEKIFKNTDELIDYFDVETLYSENMRLRSEFPQPSSGILPALKNLLRALIYKIRK